MGVDSASSATSRLLARTRCPSASCILWGLALVCVIAAPAQALAETAVADTPPAPGGPRGWLAYVYVAIAAAAAVALAAAYARGRRPLALGSQRVSWPLAPGPSLFLMLVLMAAGAAAASAAAQALGTGSADDLRARAIASLANYGAQLLLVAGIWWALRGMITHGAAAPAGAPPSIGAWRAAAVGALAMAIGWPVVQATGVVASTVQQSLSGVAAPDTAHRTLEAMGQSADAAWVAATALVAVVLAPLVEEILYRGALQQALHGLGMPRIASIACASALFAVAHWGSLVGGSEAGALAMLLVLGLIFGWAYERTGSMWAPFTAHALFNAANLAIFLAQR